MDGASGSQGYYLGTPAAPQKARFDRAALECGHKPTLGVKPTHRTGQDGNQDPRHESRGKWYVTLKRGGGRCPSNSLLFHGLTLHL
ncbi:hypothetical protein NHX12_006318 [Muraenolepis orangiensis]|uniref:Uncharacterized protein n=1 Tax=Muraenolepis orangiensis TaxID=630683 RepID=A0A9Q0DUK4_9TELE|nr:hypothetical protein NHX12_006318 [Muraenolepis orangiensis]